ncbi:MAG: hypothetical protein Q9208_007380 [Pyrenodesmia sp. 3 TL-2023]
MGKNKPKTSIKSGINHGSADAQLRLRKAGWATYARMRQQVEAQADELGESETRGDEAELNRHRRQLSPRGEPGHHAGWVTQATGRLVIHSGGAESSRANDDPDDDWEARRPPLRGKPIGPRPMHRRGGNTQPRRTATGMREGVPPIYRARPIPRRSRFGVTSARPRTLGEDLNEAHSNQQNSAMGLPVDNIANPIPGNDDEESPADGNLEEDETMGNEETSDEQSPSEGDNQETDGESDQGQHQETEEQAVEERRPEGAGTRHRSAGGLAAQRTVPYPGNFNHQGVFPQAYQPYGAGPYPQPYPQMGQPAYHPPMQMYFPGGMIPMSWGYAPLPMFPPQPIYHPQYPYPYPFPPGYP